MLANTRFLLRFLVFVAFATPWLPIAAQVQGVPPAASSSNAAKISAPEARANQTPLGAKEYSKVVQPFLGNCCGNIFLPHPRFPSKPKPPLAPGHHRHHGDDEVPGTGGNAGSVAIAVPVYIPYEIGYEPEQTDGVSEETDAEDSGYNFDSWENAEEAAEEPLEPEPVVAQPPTVLIFKDGRHTDVVNYAILGDALFDFDDGSTHKILLADLDLAATQKANDAVGVEFKLPSDVVAGAASK